MTFGESEEVNTILADDFYKASKVSSLDQYFQERGVLCGFATLGVRHGSRLPLNLPASQFFQVFNSIYGCGPAVAHRLFSHGYRTLEDLREAYRTEHDSLSKRLLSDFERFKYGLVYYEDLVQNPITLKESAWIVEKLKFLLTEYISPECQIELMGGFKR